MLSNKWLKKIIHGTGPQAQRVDRNTNNLGFGWLYYGLARLLWARWVIVIGSGKGFAPCCYAKAMNDEDRGGTVILIDPSYKGLEPPSYGGIGFWDDAEAVEQHFSSMGTQNIQLLKKTSAEALVEVEEITGGKAQILHIDGAHSFENAKEDFNLYSRFIEMGGVAVLHDSFCQQWPGVSEAVEVFNRKRWDVLTLRLWPGLTLVTRKVGSAQEG